MRRVLFYFLFFCLTLGARPLQAEESSAPPYKLVPVAYYKERWTGIAISAEGSTYLNFPRWEKHVRTSVARLAEDGALIPFPNEEANNWDPTKDPTRYWICVQSVYIDSKDFLWILDAGNPNFKGLIPGGAKLIKANPATGEILDQVLFGEKVVRPDSYLNDVRIDPALGYAYIADSGNGAIIIVDLDNHRMRRVLDDHPSTHSDGSTVKINGAVWTRGGEKPDVHIDGIALSPVGAYLYYHALTGQGLYRIATAALRDDTLTEEELGGKVELLTVTGPADGLAAGKDGEIYITALEQNAVLRWNDRSGLETVVQSPALSWPDSLFITPANVLYITTSRIHEGAQNEAQFALYKVQL